MSYLESLLDTFETGSGFWNPIVWLVIIIVAFLIIYILRGFGNRDFKKGSEQVKPFLSGNPEYDDNRTPLLRK